MTLKFLTSLGDEWKIYYDENNDVWFALFSKDGKRVSIKRAKHLTLKDSSLTQ